MGDFSHYVDIVLFAMIAGFIVLRLRGVLGRRPGNQRRQNPILGRAAAPTERLVALASRRTRPPEPAAPVGDDVAAGVEQIRAVDPGFDPAQFLDGARIAFDMIVGAFAAGDKAKLRPLLSDEVYKPFSEAIDERDAARERLETRVVVLKQFDIVEARLVDRVARVTVKFVSEQINVLRAHDGSVVDGDPAKPIEKTDFWSFTRDTRASDPNWTLVATASG